jgi:4-aminobutyrate aminotransferase
MTAGPVRERVEGDVNTSSARSAWARAHLGGRGRDLVEADSRVFLRQSLSTPVLNAVSGARGIYLEDVDGRRYMDFHGNSVHHLGYAHPKVIEAVKNQLDELSFTPRRYTNRRAVELAEKLSEITPGRLERSLFAPSGSDAIEMALKLARLATGRFKTVSFWDAFHGAGFGASSVGGEELFRGGRLGPLLSGAEHVAPPECYRCAYGYPDTDGQPRLDLCHMSCASYIRYILEREDDVAAVVAEPIRTVPIIPPPGFWTEVRQACDDHGALLIFDEIPNGLGKTGRMYSCEHYETTPDIVVTGKALGGGVVPIAAITATPELDVGGERAIGHYTHEKNPILAAAALATISVIEEEGLVEHATALGRHVERTLEELKSAHRLVGDVRNKGLLMGIELVSDPETKARADVEAERVLYRSLELGLSFKTTMGSVLTLTPPLVVTEGELDRAFGIVDQALTEIEATTLH